MFVPCYYYLFWKFGTSFELFLFCYYVVPHKRPGFVQRHCLVHGCPMGEKTRVFKGGETQPQHGVAHHSGLLCLWDLFHGLDDREGNGPPAAPGLSGGMGRTGARFETTQIIRDNGTTQLTGGGRPTAAPRDAGHPKKDPARHPPPEWPWNQRFAFGAVGGRKQRNQVREGITLTKNKEGRNELYDTRHVCMHALVSNRIGLLRWEAPVLGGRETESEH